MGLAKGLQKIFIPALLLGTLLAAGPATAQTPSCEERRLDNPPRVMVDCGGGILIEREAAVEMGFISATGGAAIEVNSGAVLVEVDAAQGGFQIRTPQAIATVRGTIYAVDVSDGHTAVFVERGVVEVAPIEGGEAATLQAGEGVDVTPGEPLVVREWGAGRVAELMARFGR
ncbi:FecR family protein [Acuticoccus sp. M5D2P5]|uniref:FecR family protein n=1 Tax=Acuticoccus kalidii TaxID=2910977 RepID=UPI001F32094C|nr:FecR family protein [Acuticoccus kalidii]MCF3935919.1 FecR family protein [Acuticoccus kalidii]